MGVAIADPPPHTSSTPAPESAREFAVLVAHVAHEGEECILLTRRPEGLSRYAGQVAFPGGEREPRDQSLLETALRETEEEVGIPRAQVELVRELAWHQTLLGHRVKPFVARVSAPCIPRPDPREVERILFLPARRLKPELFHIRGKWKDPAGREHLVYTFPLDGFEVWGLTARILRELVCGPMEPDGQ